MISGSKLPLAESKTIRLDPVAMPAETKEWKDLQEKSIYAFRVLSDGRYAIVHQKNKVSIVSPENKIDASTELPETSGPYIQLHVIPGDRFLCQALIREDEIVTYILNSDLTIFAKINVFLRTAVAVSSHCIVGLRGLLTEECDDSKVELCSYNLRNVECKTSVINCFSEEDACVLSRPVVHPMTGNLIIKSKSTGSLRIYQPIHSAEKDEFKEMSPIENIRYRVGEGRLISLNDGRLISYTHTTEGRNFLQILDNGFDVGCEFEIDKTKFPLPQFRLLPLPDPFLVCGGPEVNTLFVININSKNYSKIPIPHLKTFDINSQGEIVVVTHGASGSKILFIDLECMKLYRDGIFNLLEERHTIHRNLVPGISPIIHACLFRSMRLDAPTVEDLRASFSEVKKLTS